MDGIQIIRLAPEDWQSLKVIRLESLKSDPAAFGGKFEDESTNPDEKWQERASDPNRFFLVAKDGERIVGLVGIAKSRDLGEEDVSILLSMYVNREYRGRGIGKALVKSAIDQAREIPQMNKVKLWVHEEQVEAFSLYKSCGFICTEKIGEDPELDPMYHNTTVMELPL
jgi:ribosomal protein S18 acetylase RimI-like enzyme